jgi:cell division control protein 6
LGELENLGLAVSRAVSRGRHGYGRQYRLTVQPDIVGGCFAGFWAELANVVESMQGLIRDYEDLSKSIEVQEPERIKARYRARDARIAWKDFVDL